MKNTIISIMSVVVSFVLGVVAVGWKMYWILGLMFIAGVCGIIILAYLKSKHL